MCGRWVSGPPFVETGLAGTLRPREAVRSLAPIVFDNFSRYNTTFLTGTVAVLAWTALALVEFFGPAAVALTVGRVRG